MADGANVQITATVLPDEIQKTFSASMSVEPADGNDKWYYKLTSVPNAAQALITGAFTDYTAVDSATAPLAIDTTADLIKFLFVKNTHASESIYMTIDGVTAPDAVVGNGIHLGPNQGLVLRIPNCVVQNVIAVSSAGTVECLVAALIDDVA